MGKVRNINLLKINLLFHFSVLALVIVLNPPEKFGISDISFYILTRIFPLIIFYICYFRLVPYFLAKKKTLQFLVYLLITLNLGTVISVFIVELFHDYTFHIKFHFYYSLKTHLSGMFVLTIASIFGIAFRSVTGWYEEMQKKSILEKEKLESELKLLKTQVNPHFLFNTLNTIDYLISSNPPKASESLIKLSSLLRYVIYDTTKDLVPLQKEIEQVEAYIELQKLRLHETLSIIYEKKGNFSGKMISPMIFMPFVENVFKHTDDAGIQKGVKISFSVKENALEFSSSNHISLKKVSDGGFGLENLKKRLELQYKERYSLSITDEDGIFTVVLKIIL